MIHALLLSMVLVSAEPVIAVVDYRSGVQEQFGFANRLARLLRSKSGAKVLAPATVRMKYAGGDLYDDMIKCDAEPRCLARIGRRVGATDLLYVSIGKIGNILISVMRISTATGKEVAAYTMEVPPGTRISQLQMYKILHKLFPPSFFVRYGTIRIFSNVEGASVYINKKKVGTTPLEKQVLPAGRRYTIEVRKDGYTSFSISLRLVPEGDMRVDAHLSKKVVITTGTVTPWYKKWWVWAGAAAVVTAGAVGTYYLMQPSEAEGWVRVE